MGRGGGGKGGYNWRQHTQASDDVEVQAAARERIERLVHDASRDFEVVEDLWGAEKNTYKMYCRMYGLAMVKVGRGGFRLEKVDNQVHPFSELLEILVECTGGSEMQVRELLYHVKSSEPDLWTRLTVKGITNTSERKLMNLEDEVREYFDVSPDWRFIAPKGALEKEYAKPIKLGCSQHAKLVQEAMDAMRAGVLAARQLATGHRATGDEMFCAFGPRVGASLQRCAERVLAQQSQPGYVEMLRVRERLPAFQRRAEIIDAFEAHRVLVVCGSTGCGKTTQLPQLILERLAEGAGGRILCTQPRRISATSVAERVAAERGESLGEAVGYQIRFECKAGPETSLLYCTVGILLRHLTSNPNLEGVSLIIVDEVHERDVHTDFALLILRDLVNGPRPDLKLVLMSATINAAIFIDYFSSPKLEVGYVEIPGKTNYPIVEYFAEDILRDLLPKFTPAGPPPVKFVNAGGDSVMRNSWASSIDLVASKLSGEPEYVQRGISNMLRRPLNKLDIDLIGQLIVYITSHETPGSILVFVPGWQDIADVVKKLERLSKSASEAWRIYPLHSMVPPAEQRRIFQTLPAGERKIIVSTNLAETSITVEDVVFVIDTGIIKGTAYTPETNVASLECQLVSRSNIQQRRGRAGRCRPGVFYKLYSKLEYNENMSDSLPPEMQRTPVEELCLQVKSLSLPGSVAEVLGKALAPPASLSVAHAMSLLQGLGALDENEELTTLGWKLSAMPLHPSLGKMLLLGSLFGCVPELLSVCATLSAKSPFVLPFGKEKEADAAKQKLGYGLLSDHMLYAKVSKQFNALDHRSRDEFCRDNFLSDKSLQMIGTMRRDLRRYLQELKLAEDESHSGRAESMEACQAELLAVLGASLPLASRLPNERKFKCLEASSASCSLHPSSLLEWLSSPKRSRGGSGSDQEEYTLLCWFSRMKTAELYLHDSSLLADVLPVLLLSPKVTRRNGDEGVFDVKGSVGETLPEGSAVAQDAGGKGQQDGMPKMVTTIHKKTKARKPKPVRPVLDSWEDGNDEQSHSEEDNEENEENEETAAAGREDGQDNDNAGMGVQASSDREARRSAKPRSSLLIVVQDKQMANMLWDLRRSVQELVGTIIGEPPFRVPREVGIAFHALRQLLAASYSVHGKDWSACKVVSRNSSNVVRAKPNASDTDDDDIMGTIARERRQARQDVDGRPGWKGAKGGKGKAGGGKGGRVKGGGGYPWWQHIRSGK